jgi:hypothetical protein
MTPVLGASKTDAIIEQLDDVEKLANVRDLVRSSVTS